MAGDGEAYLLGLASGALSLLGNPAKGEAFLGASTTADTRVSAGK